jgi:hypothetical protein
MAAKIANRKRERTVTTSDPLYHVVDEDGREVYPGGGVDREEAERLSAELVAPSSVIPANRDGFAEEAERIEAEELDAELAVAA